MYCEESTSIVLCVVLLILLKENVRKYYNELALMDKIDSRKAKGCD